VAAAAVSMSITSTQSTAIRQTITARDWFSVSGGEGGYIAVDPKDNNILRVVRDGMNKTSERFAAARAQLEAQRDRIAAKRELEGSARERAVKALERQVEHLRDAADQARAAGMSIAEIGSIVRVDPDLLRRWLLADSLDDADPA